MMTKGQKGFFSSNHIRPNVFLSMDELERHLRVFLKLTEILTWFLMCFSIKFCCQLKVLNFSSQVFFVWARPSLPLYSPETSSKTNVTISILYIKRKSAIWFLSSTQILSYSIRTVHELSIVQVIRFKLRSR